MERMRTVPPETSPAEAFAPGFLGRLDGVSGPGTVRSRQATA